MDPLPSSLTHGEYTPFVVPMALHECARRSLRERFQLPDVPERSLLLFAGGQQLCRHETDHEELFRQESSFHYLFGVREPDCFGFIEAKTARTTLFFPRLPEAYAIWMGDIKSLEYFKNLYEVDEVMFVDELQHAIARYAPARIYVSKGVNTDSGTTSMPAHFDGMEEYNIDESRLYADVVACRTIKNEEEIKLMKFVNAVSSEAHFRVMQQARPGMMEFQLESLFLHHVYFHGGCRLPSYTSIAGSGKNSAILHYGHAGAPNDKRLGAADMVLCDMGAELYCYASDITNSFPSNGVFSQKQKLIFETVQRMQWAVLDAMRPGVVWVDMHALAYRVMCEELKAAGLLIGDVNDMMSANVPAVLMPHGLGHLLGIDTHDVGGYPAGIERDARDGYRSVRCGLRLQPGMVITVEPGIYFISHCLKKGFSDPQVTGFFNWEAIDGYRDFGGIRLEDNVLITDIGIENLTTAPRTVSDVEGVMQGRITSLAQLHKRL